MEEEGLVPEAQGRVADPMVVRRGGRVVAAHAAAGGGLTRQRLCEARDADLAEAGGVVGERPGKAQTLRSLCSMFHVGRAVEHPVAGLRRRM